MLEVWLHLHLAAWTLKEVLHYIARMPVLLVVLADCLWPADHLTGLI